MRALFFLAAVFSVTTADAGDLITQMARCAFCHGADGIAGNPIWPSLAGQDAGYLERRMLSYRAGDNTSQNAQQMRFVLNALSDADIASIAKYYAALDPAKPAGGATARGSAIYHAGIEGRSGSCASCHGARGEGNADLLAPRLAGQSAHYMVNQLAAYADGMRPHMDSGMAETALALSVDERQAVSRYLQSMAPTFPVESKDEE
ncbi:MAG: c-type cytochrome [Pseudomonadota bacterium]